MEIDMSKDKEYLVFRIHSKDIKVICSSLCDLYNMYCNMEVDGNNVDAYLGAFKIFIEYMNIISKLEKKDSDYPYIVMLLEAYYKFRHDMFASIFLTHYNQFDMYKFSTDAKFTDLGLEIDSNKTPDFIKISQDKILILEFSVGSSYDRLQFIKKEEQGGKYLKEVKELIEQGYDVKCYNVLLSTVEMDFNLHKMIFEEIEQIFDIHPDLEGYKAIVDEYLAILKLVDNSILQYSVILFSDAYNLNVIDIDSIQDYYGFDTGNRKDSLITQIKVDSDINYCYDRVRGGLLKTVCNMKKKEIKDRHILLYQGQRLLFDKASNGISIQSWNQILNNDDRKAVFDNTYYLMGGKRVHSSVSKKTMVELVYKKSKEQPSFYIPAHKMSVGKDFIGTCEPNERHQQLASKIKTLDLEYKPNTTLADIEIAVGNMLNLSHPNTLAESILDMNMVKNAVDKLKNKYNSDNENIPIRFKSSFTLPLTHYLENMSILNFKDELLGQLEQDRYTHAALCRWDFLEFIGTDPTGNQKYFDCYEKHKLNMYQLNKLTGGMPVVEYKKEAVKEDLESLKIYQDEIKKSLGEMAKISKELKLKNNSSNMIKLKGMEYKNLYRKELEHFNLGKGTKTKCMIDHNARDGLEMDFEELVNYITSVPYKPEPIRMSTKLFHEDYEGEEIKMVKGMLDIVKFLDGTQLSSICNFIAFLCHKLTYVSQMNFNTDYVYMDYWGSMNHIVIVKGGKKIFKTKASKHFRLIYPAHESVVPWQVGQSGSSKVIIINRTKFILTPWMRLSEKVITENIFFREKVYGYMVPHIAREIEIRSGASMEQILTDSLFPVILSLHNRRRTEARLHSLRYIIANTLASFTNLIEIIEAFSDTASDRMIQFIITGILRYYPIYAKSVINNKHRLQKVVSNGDVNHPYLPTKIYSINHLSSIIYGTYLMTKSPADQSLDQAINLKGILDTHLKYEGLTSYNDNLKYNKPPENIFEDDLCYNADYCYYLGVMASDYLKGCSNFDVRARWENYMKKPWTAMANSSGLRSKDNSHDFFGKKGHYVIHKDNINDVRDKIDELNDYLSMEDRTAAYNKIKNLNKTFSDKLQGTEIEELIFHAVDKDQRGGGREIYVMDKITKLFQQPLEYIFSEISSNLHNEVISVPSSKRLMLIHSKIFEKTSCFENNVRFYLTMDCRKWAPRSQLNKYICLINGMKNVLPASLVLHFYYFFRFMYTKKMVTRDRIVNILAKNERYKDLVSMLKESKGPDYKYINMGYSFMMGIFNYLSSILHSMNQLHASMMIKSLFHTHKIRVNLDMIAHSDDSAGYVDFETPYTNMNDRIKYGESQLYYVLKTYEILLKLCNHMLSVKKCNVSHNYFEFLSILYINNALVPVITKFTSSTIFKPTDKGYFCDMMQPINKCIETIRMGGTFSEGYFLQRLLSMAIQRFYSTKARSDIIPQLGGDVLAHPILSLLVGTSGDIIRLYHKDRDELLFQLAILMKMSNPNETDIFGSITAQPYIKNKYIADFPDVEEIWGIERDLWPLMNMQFNNSITETLTFLCKLRNIDFIASLMNETTSRRISRSFFYKRAPVYHIQNYKFTLKHTLKLIIEMLNVKAVNDLLVHGPTIDLDWIEIVLQKLYNDLLVFNLATVLNYDNAIHTAVECKPVHISIPISPTPFAVNFDVDSLIIKHFFPEYLNLLPNRDFTKHYELFCRYLRENNLEKVKSPKIIRNIFARFKENNDVNIYMYAYVTSECRYVNNLQTMLQLIQSNTSYGYNYNKLNVSLHGTSDQVFSSRFTYMREPDEKIKLAAFFLHLMVATCNNPQANLLDELEFEFEGKSITGADIRVVLNNVFRINLSLNTNLIPIDQKLGELQLWYTWTKLQKRVGVSWYGKGTVYLNLLQCKLEIQVKDSEVVRVTCDKKSVEFNDLEQWFLQQILNTGRRCILACTDMLGRNDYSFGMKKGKFVITTVNNMDSFCFNFDYKEKMDELDEYKIFCTTPDGRYMARKTHEAFKIEFAHNLIPFTPKDLTRYLKISSKNRGIINILKIDSKFNTYMAKALSFEMRIDGSKVVKTFKNTSVGWHYCRVLFNLLKMARPASSLDVLKQAKKEAPDVFHYLDPRDVHIPQLIASGVDTSEIYELLITHQLKKSTIYGLIDRAEYAATFYKLMDGYYGNPSLIESVKRDLGGLFNVMMLCGATKTVSNFRNIFFMNRENIHYQFYKEAAKVFLDTVRGCLCNHECVFDFTKHLVYPITKDNFRNHFDTILTLFYKQCIYGSQTNSGQVFFNPMMAQLTLYNIFICQVGCPTCRMIIIKRFEENSLLRTLPVEESENWLKVIIMLSNALKRRTKFKSYMVHENKKINFNSCENLREYEDPMIESIHDTHDGLVDEEDCTEYTNDCQLKGKLRCYSMNTKHSNITYAPVIGYSYFNEKNFVSHPKILKLRFLTNTKDSLLFQNNSVIIAKIDDWQVIKADFNMNPTISYHYDWHQFDIYNPGWAEFCTTGEFFGKTLDQYDDVVDDFADDEPPEPAEFEGVYEGARLYSSDQDIINNDENRLIPLFDLTWGHNQQYKCLYHLKRFVAVVGYLPDEFLQLKTKGIYCLRASESTSFIKDYYIKSYYYLIVRHESMAFINSLARELRLTHVRHKIFESPTLEVNEEFKPYSELSRNEMLDETILRGQWIRSMEKEVEPEKVTDLVQIEDSVLENIISKPMIPEDIDDVVRFQYGNEMIYISKDRLMNLAESKMLTDRWWKLLELDNRVVKQRTGEAGDMAEAIKQVVGEFDIENMIKGSIQVQLDNADATEEAISELLKTKKIHYDPTMPHFMVSNKATAEYSCIRDNIGFCAEFDAIAPGMVDLLASGRLSVRPRKKKVLDLLIKELKSVYLGTGSDQERFFDFISVLLKQTLLVETDVHKHIWDNVENLLSDFLPEVDETIESTRINYTTDDFERGDSTFF